MMYRVALLAATALLASGEPTLVLKEEEVLTHHEKLMSMAQAVAQHGKAEASAYARELVQKHEGLHKMHAADKSRLLNEFERIFSPKAAARAGLEWTEEDENTEGDDDGANHGDKPGLEEAREG